MGFREDVRDGTVTTLTAFAVANSTIVDRVYRARPGALAEGRSLFVGGITEDMTLDSGTFGRTASVEVLATGRFADNAETVDRVDELGDAVIEWLAQNAHAHDLGINTLLEPTRSQSVEIDEGNGIIVPAVSITCRARILQGRS